MERPSSAWTGWEQPAFAHPSQILSPLFPFLVFSSWDQYWEAWEKTRYKGRSDGLLGISFKLDNWHPGWWRKGKVQWNQIIRWSEMNVDPSLRHLKSEFPQIILCRPPPSPPWSSPKYQSPDPRQSSWPPKIPAKIFPLFKTICGVKSSETERNSLNTMFTEFISILDEFPWNYCLLKKFEQKYVKGHVLRTLWQVTIFSVLRLLRTSCALMFDYLLECLKIFEDVWLFIRMFEDVWKCLKMFKDALKMFEDVWLFIRMLPAGLTYHLLCSIAVTSLTPHWDKT